MLQQALQDRVFFPNRVLPDELSLTKSLRCYDQLLDEKKLQQIDNLYKDFETPDAASKV